jgi:hypothetical protein
MRLNYIRFQFIITEKLGNKVGDFGFAMPENIAKNTDFIW